MWFTRKRKSDSPGGTRDLREQVLALDAAVLGLAPTPARPHVWGVLMETAYPEAVATLMVLADGTTSIYFSNGGGVIGAGAHAAVQAAGQTFLNTAERHLGEFSPVEATPLPRVGQVQFYVRTFEGTLGSESSEEDLGNGRHTLSPLFHAGHAVITAVRESTPAV